LNTNNIIDEYWPDVVAANDYYPFGVKMKERSFSSENTRYQFNGKQFDEETETNDFGARMLDGDLGIWGAVDPLQSKYPDLCPYNFAGNSPIIFFDIDGKKFVNPYTALSAEAQLNVAKAQDLYNQFVKNNPDLSPKQIKKSQEAQNLNSATGELEKIKAKEKEVNIYLNTLKITNEKEYNYFETLTDKKGNELKVVVNLEDINMTGGNVGGTTGFAAFPEGDVLIPTSTKAGFQIVLYREAKNKPLKFEYEGGRNFNTFSNELGDIKYFMEKVKDRKSLEYFKYTADGDSPGYTNPDGAGEFSTQYENARVKDVKSYKTKENEVKNSVKNTIESK